MLNKLTFPEGGTETRYLWNKHQINYDGEHVWSVYNVAVDNHYFWDKYTRQAPINTWDIYNVTAERTYYYWDVYPAISAYDYVNLTNEIVYKKYPIKDSYYAYIKGSGSGAVSVANSTGRHRLPNYCGWVRLFRLDMSYVDYCGEQYVDSFFEVGMAVNGFVGYGYAKTQEALPAGPTVLFLTNEVYLQISSGYLYIDNDYSTTYRAVITNGYVGQFGTSSTLPSGYSKIHQMTDINYPDLDGEYSFTTTKPNSYTSIYINSSNNFLYTDSNIYIPVYNDWVPNYSALITTYGSNDINAYPTGFIDETKQFYERRKATSTVYFKGSNLQGTVSSYDNTDYPTNGMYNGKWYYLNNGYPYVWKKYDFYTTVYEWKVYDEYVVQDETNNTTIIGYSFDKTTQEDLYLYLNSSATPTAVSKTEEFWGGTDLQSGAFRLYFSDGTQSVIRAYNDEYLTEYANGKDIVAVDIPDNQYSYYRYYVLNSSTVQYKKGNFSGYGYVLGDLIYVNRNHIVGYGFGQKDNVTNYYLRKASYTVEVIANTMDAYPTDGYGEDGAYYVLKNTLYDEVKTPYGDYTTITSTNINEYPIYEWNEINQKFYVLNQIPIIEPDGNYTEIRTYNPTDYPTNGLQDECYYEYVGEERVGDSRGEYIETVESSLPDTYPQDEGYGEYWYVFKEHTYDYVIGDYIEDIRDEEDIYIHNGIQGDYWYVYQEYDENGPFKSKYTSGTVNSNVRSDYPDDAIQGNFWYDYQYNYEDYICHIYNDKIKGGVKYKQDINPEADYTVGCVASAEVTFDYDNSLDDFQKYIDYKYFDYYIQQPNDNYEWRLIGRFWLDDVKYKRSTVSAKAYDAIVAKDIYIDEFIAETEFPISLTNFFHNLCNFCGVVGVINGNLANTSFAFADNFQAINITARQIFQYIAEMAGGFIYVNAQGQVELRTYSATGTTLDKSKYVSYNKSRYNTHNITGLTVKVNTDDLGVSTGDIETNRYIVENNPLFYCQSESEISGAVSALQSALANKIYTPAKIELLQDFGINCGDIITVNGDTVYVMKKNITASGVTLECVGQEYRDKEPTSINSDIIALRGKTNELYRDLEQTRSTITDVEAGLRSEITQTAERLTSEFTAKDSETNEDLQSLISQTAEEIRMEVSRTNAETEETLRSEYQQTAENITLTVENQGKSISQLELRADSIESSVSNTQNEISTIKQTANSIESRVEGAEGQISSIRQDLDGIDLSYSSSTGTASITVGNITVKVPSEDGVEDIVEERVGIEMNGYVQFVDLEEEGETTIHGGNITTGKVNADYLGLYGWMNVKQRYSGTRYVGNGGYIGYSTGNDGVNGTTEGIAVSASGLGSYFIATNSGARLTCGDSMLVVMDGQISANEPIGSGSDERIKNTINHDLDRYEEFYKGLKPACYKYNHGTSDRYHTGFIAQEVEEAINNNGITNQDFAGLIQIKGDADGIQGAEYQDQYYLRYEEFIALNTYMIQKLMARVDELEAEVKTLKGE